MTSSQKSDLTKDGATASNTAEMPPEKFEINCEVAKVDADLGVVFGWAIVSTEDGQPYVDLQKDHIPDESMLKATRNFAKGARIAKEMHVGGGRGTVLFLLPLTADVAKSLELQTRRTGLIIGMAPDPEMLEKFRSGELRGFSIGGRRIVDREVEV